MDDNFVTYYKEQIDVPELLSTLKDLHGYSFEDPFYICDLSDIVSKFNMWKKCMPRIKPFYAVKCNYYHAVLEVLVKLGAKFDCASANEIKMVLSLGAKPNQIIYANPIKQISHILYAKDCDVKKMSFDNECELYKIKKYFPGAELLIRIRYDAKKAICKLGIKFGCDPETEAYDLLTLARSLNLNVVGVCFHVGSGCEEFAAYGKAIKAARNLFDYCAKLGMPPLKILDIGGGFSHDKLLFARAFKIINESIEKYFPDDSVTIISEPGRYFVAEAFTLVTKVHSVIERKINDQAHNMYHINVGIHTAFSHMLYGAKETKPEYIRETDGKSYKSIIWGPTCNSGDKMFENILMPKLEIDDVIIFKNMGAYTISMAAPFNCMSLPFIKLFMNVKHEHLTPNSFCEDENEIMLLSHNKCIT